MAHTVVTLDEARDGLLHPTLDAISLNGRQRDLMLNLRTPEIDSGVEWVSSLQRFGVPSSEITRGLAFFRELIDLNSAEGESSRSVAGVADRLAREAEDATGKLGKTVRSLARELRPHLRVMKQRHHADPVAYVRACRAVSRAIDGVPSERVLCTFMRTELGPGSFGLLERIVAESTEVPA